MWLDICTTTSIDILVMSYLSSLCLVRRHRTYNAMSLTSRHTSSSSSLSGVVYFADVNQLRAAIKEMHDYKLTTSVSRNTGFGQTQSIHYLR